MKKKVMFFLFVFIAVITLGLVFKVFISASMFDSAVSYSNIKVNITVDAFPPDIIIDSPTSKEYNSSEIDLNFSVSDSWSDVDTVWYNLNNGANNTIKPISNITFTVTEDGEHTLYIFANDSVGFENGTESVTFTVNKIVLRNDFDGSTTNFSQLTDEELENIENMSLEVSNFGKIVFIDNISLDFITDLDSNVKISINNISIDIDSLPNLDKPATLKLYNILFKNPRILRDGSVCPSDVCTIVSYTNNILEFTVTGFTRYSAEETPSVPGPTGEVVGGGGGAGVRYLPKTVSFSEFKVNPDLIKVKLKHGETKFQRIVIENTGDLTLEGIIDPTEVKDFITLSDYAFELKPKQSKEITAVFTVPATIDPDIYSKKLFVKTKDLVKPIIIVIEVESKEPLFEVDMSIPPEYKKLTAGDSIVRNIVITNIGLISRVDVNLDYIIKDLEGNIVDIQQETVSVEDLLRLTKRIKTPKDIKLGDYIFYVKLSYNSDVIISSDLFSIVSLEEEPSWLSQQISRIYSLKFIKVVTVFIIAIMLLSLILKRKIGRNFVKKILRKIKRKFVGW